MSLPEPETKFVERVIAGERLQLRAPCDIHVVSAADADNLIAVHSLLAADFRVTLILEQHDAVAKRELVADLVFPKYVKRGMLTCIAGHSTEGTFEYFAAAIAGGAFLGKKKVKESNMEAAVAPLAATLVADPLAAAIKDADGGKAAAPPVAPVAPVAPPVPGAPAAAPSAAMDVEGGGKAAAAAAVAAPAAAMDAVDKGDDAYSFFVNFLSEPSGGKGVLLLLLGTPFSLLRAMQHVTQEKGSFTRYDKLYVADGNNITSQLMKEFESNSKYAEVFQHSLGNNTAVASLSQAGEALPIVNLQKVAQMFNSLVQGDNRVAQTSLLINAYLIYGSNKITQEKETLSIFDNLGWTRYYVNYMEKQRENLRNKSMKKYNAELSSRYPDCQDDWQDWLINRNLNALINALPDMEIDLRRWHSLGNELVVTAIVAIAPVLFGDDLFATKSVGAGYQVDAKRKAVLSDSTGGQMLGNGRSLGSNMVELVKRIVAIRVEPVKTLVSSSSGAAAAAAAH